MSSPKISLLGYVLLGLLSDHPSSGYDVRKMFSTTPIGTFSDSPGAIYPALQRLETSGLIRGEIEHRGGLRRRKVFRPTAAGTRALKRWLGEPVTRDNVVRGMYELTLRFSFIEGVMGPRESARFLAALERELNAYIPTLKGFLAVNRAEMPLAGALALESGIRGYEAQVQWARVAVRAYKKRRGKS